jgi:NADH:ubiquinone oxidoreductase subunit K
VSAMVVACLLFCLGLYGVITRREIVAILASVEVMLGGATLLFVVLGASLQPADAAQAVQAISVLLLAVVAAEAAVGLALLVALVRSGRSGTDELTEVRG